MHIAFAGTAERFITKTLGRAQVGEPGDGPYDHSNGSGYLSAKIGDYKHAIARKIDVRPLIHETTGGLHGEAQATLRMFARAHATRHDGIAKGPSYSAYLRRHRARISRAIALGLAFELRRGAHILARRACATPGAHAAS